MIRDLDILKIMTVKSYYEQYMPCIDEKTLCRETVMILQDLKSYYERFNKHTTDQEEFYQFFHNLRHPGFSLQDKDQYDRILQRMFEPLEGTAKELIERYSCLNMLATVKKRVQNGESVSKSLQILDDYQATVAKNTTVEEFVNISLNAVLAATDSDNGYSWRLQELNGMLGKVQVGVFGVVAARPNMGKSSWLISEVSYLCQQLQNGETILWFNNEGQGKDIIPRLYTAMFNCRREQIIERQEKAEEQFLKRGGSKIKILDVHQYNYKRLEKIIKQEKPRIVIIDMLDHVQDSYGSKQETVDAKFGRLYQWARAVASSYNCTIIGTSQVNEKGEGKAVPWITNLAGSATLKQGAVTWQIMIGSESRFGTSRVISVPKSKIASKRYRCDVVLDAEKGLYISNESPWRYYG